jgi:hypothetical protein
MLRAGRPRNGLSLLGGGVSRTQGKAVGRRRPLSRLLPDEEREHALPPRRRKRLRLGQQCERHAHRTHAGPSRHDNLHVVRGWQEGRGEARPGALNAHYGLTPAITTHSDGLRSVKSTVRVARNTVYHPSGGSRQSSASTTSLWSPSSLSSCNPPVGGERSVLVAVQRRRTRLAATCLPPAYHLNVVTARRPRVRTVSVSLALLAQS